MQANILERNFQMVQAVNTSAQVTPSAYSNIVTEIPLVIVVVM
jgi:hypothetical protein